MNLVSAAKNRKTFLSLKAPTVLDSILGMFMTALWLSIGAAVLDLVTMGMRVPATVGGLRGASFTGVYLFAFYSAFFYGWTLVLWLIAGIANRFPARQGLIDLKAAFTTALFAPGIGYVSYLLFQGAGISKHWISGPGPYITGCLGIFLFYVAAAFSFDLKDRLNRNPQANRLRTAFVLLFAGILLGAIYWITSHYYIRGYAFLHVAMVTLFITGLILVVNGALRLKERPAGKLFSSIGKLVLHLSLVGSCAGIAFTYLDENPRIQYLMSNEAVIGQRYLHVYYHIRNAYKQKKYAGRFDHDYEQLKGLRFDNFPEETNQRKNPLFGIAKGKNIVWIMVDTLRSDHLGFYGYGRNTSPAFDALAAESVVFKNAFAQYPYTNYSFVSFMHSRFFPKSNVEEWPLIGRRLEERGYAVEWISPIEGVKRLSPNFTDMRIFDRVDGASITQKGLEFLRTRNSDHFLLFLHYFEPHLSYDTDHPDYRVFGQEKVDLYDASVLIADREIGKVVGHLKANGLYDKTVIIIMADHGLEMYERGSWTHAFTVYNEMLRVPLLLHAPGLPARVIEQKVRLADLMPTLYDFLGISSPALFEGKSLLEMIDGSGKGSRPIFARRDEYFEAAIKNDWKIIHGLKGNVYELYDLKKDPGERNNVINQYGKMAREMKDYLKEFRYFYNGWGVSRKFKKGVPADKVIGLYEAAESPSKQMALLNYLEYSRTEDAMLFFIDVLKNEGPEYLRKSAALKLRHFPLKQAEDALAEAVVNDPAMGVRLAGFQSLLSIHPERARSVLLDNTEGKNLPSELVMFGQSLIEASNPNSPE